tara:strand:+ start:3754 stop:3906 length:153 start_codon:yes stop_codon:yes gene_type:complete
MSQASTPMLEGKPLEGSVMSVYLIGCAFLGLGIGLCIGSVINIFGESEDD